MSESNPQTNKQRLNSIIGNAILGLIIIGLLFIDYFLNVSVRFSRMLLTVWRDRRECGRRRKAAVALPPAHRANLEGRLRVETACSWL